MNGKRKMKEKKKQIRINSRNGIGENNREEKKEKRTYFRYYTPDLVKEAEEIKKNTTNTQACTDFDIEIVYKANK